MIIFVDNGNSVPDKAEGDGPHWKLYWRFKKERPDLLSAMEDAIREAVESKTYMNPKGGFPNSTWLGSKLMENWDKKDEWDRWCSGQDASSSLFGMVMRTVMYNDSRYWCTVKTENANPGREERVYWQIDDTRGERMIEWIKQSVELKKRLGIHGARRTKR